MNILTRTLNHRPIYFVELDHVQSLEMMATPIPKRDWQRYLANKENTKELFSFLSKQLSSNAQLDDILLLSSLSDKVLINKSNAYDTSRIQPSNHIEADTRIFLHLADAAHSGHTKAYIRTVDSDVVVLAVALFNEIATLTHLWIGFGTGNTTKISQFMTYVSALQRMKPEPSSSFMH